ncbi:unnamed protein product [Linum trigynum]|uniref:LOB domain-containing protein n=1 Tax=Linum trigynum TaxID=586398 RepID=A0AAV2EBL5_9ROSI
MASSGSGTTTTTSTTTGGAGSPCGACKFLRRKCAADCIFAPYFCSEQGPARFAAIHKVFGASNVSKLLLHVPPADRCEAVVTIAYEAQARLRDPVYGCVAHIFALQHQVAYLQAQLMQMKAQLAGNCFMDSPPRNNNNNTETNQYHGSWQENNDTSTNTATAPVAVEWGSAAPFSAAAADYLHRNYGFNPTSSIVSPQSSPDSADYSRGADDLLQHMMFQSSAYASHNNPKKRPYNNELGDLQALALRMMRN